MQFGDRSVGDLNDGQRRVLGLHEQHGDALVVDRGAHRLCERGRRQQWGNQHHAAEVTDGELVAQRANRGGIHGVSPGHTGGCQSVAGRDRALAGADDRGDHLVDHLIGSSQLNVVMFHGGTVGVLALDKQQADRRGCH